MQDSTPHSAYRGDGLLKACHNHFTRPDATKCIKKNSLSSEERRTHLRHFFIQKNSRTMPEDERPHPRHLASPYGGGQRL